MLIKYPVMIVVSVCWLLLTLLDYGSQSAASVSIIRICILNLIFIIVGCLACSCLLVFANHPDTLRFFGVDNQNSMIAIVSVLNAVLLTFLKLFLNQKFGNTFDSAIWMAVASSGIATIAVVKVFQRVLSEIG